MLSLKHTSSIGVVSVSIKKECCFWIFLHFVGIKLKRYFIYTGIYCIYVLYFGRKGKFEKTVSLFCHRFMILVR